MCLTLALTVTSIIATFAVGRALDVGKSTSSISQKGHHARDLIGKPVPQDNRSSPKQVRRTIRFRRDGAIQGFFSDDHASDADWKKFTEKGGALMCGLNGDDEQAGLQMGDKRTPPSAASPWSGDLTQELETWKWSGVNPSTYSCRMNDHWKIPEAMKALGLNGKPESEGGDNACYRVEHWNPKPAENERQIPAINQWYTVDGTEYQATQAHYEFGINLKGGAIYGFFLDSPLYAASNTWYGGRKPADPTKLPKLRAFSDILWGYWNRNNADVKNIKYFFMLGISNDQTNQLIATCLQKAGKQLSEWPGMELDTSTGEGHALLGSPNGAAFAYFLMQHKAELGHKTITHVSVFRAETDDDLAFVDPHLVFHVDDVKEEDGEDEQEMVDETAKVRSVRAYKL